jgi:hypothetical protein
LYRESERLFCVIFFAAHSSTTTWEYGVQKILNENRESADLGQKHFGKRLKALKKACLNFVILGNSEL